MENERKLRTYDFFVVVTGTFRTLHVFVVIERGTRRTAHANPTAHPDADWSRGRLAIVESGSPWADLLDALQHQGVLIQPDLAGDGADAEHRLYALAQVVEIIEDERAGRAADSEYVELACEQAFVVGVPS
jgi:hypothetical protein